MNEHIQFLKANKVLFATNGDIDNNEMLKISIMTYSKLIDSNLIVIPSYNGKCYGYTCFLQLIQYAIQNNFNYIVYIDADCFIVNSKNFIALLKDFIESECIYGGPSDGGLFCHRNVNKYAINPFLSFFNISKIKKYYNNANNLYDLLQFTTENVSEYSKQRLNDTLSTYCKFRKMTNYVVQHAIDIQKSYNIFSQHYGVNQIPWSCRNDNTFEPYYKLFLGLHRKNENVYYMYGSDYVDYPDNTGITSAIYCNNNINNFDNIVCLHSWFARAFLNNDDFGKYHTNRIKHILSFIKCLINDKNEIINKPQNCNITIYGKNNKIICMENVTIKGNIYIGTPECECNNTVTYIGKDTTSSAPITIRACEHNTSIFIGENCLFAEGTKILASDTHTILDKNNKISNKGKFIKIGNHVWTGINAVILKNTIIPNNSILGIYTVASGTKYINDGSIIVGNPGKCVKFGYNWNEKRINAYEQQLLNI